VNCVLFCKLDGKLSRWEAGDVAIEHLPQLFKDVEREVRSYRGNRGPVLALLTPAAVVVLVDNTPKY
jgi:hypothetical protein